MLLSCGAGKESWESLGFQGDQTKSSPKEIDPKYSLVGPKLKLKLQYLSHQFPFSGGNPYCQTLIYLSRHMLCTRACSVTQLCLTFCYPMDCNLPGSSVHGIFQARILAQVAISYSRGSSRPRDRTHISWVSCISRQILFYWATWSPCYAYTSSYMYACICKQFIPDWEAKLLIHLFPFFPI